MQLHLPPVLSYHSLAHTLDVYQSAQTLAKAEGITGQALMLLKTAALYHDSGFIHGMDEHEQRSCEIARKHLPEFGFTSAEVKQICSMIMATKLPQSPSHKLEEILCDADLDYLGRKDFYTIGHTLFQEFKSRGIVQGEEDWNRLQVQFLHAHTYFTPTAQKLRAPQKARYLAELEAIVSSYAA
ncbi:MAG: HD domain-containing protein [Bacteroidota bacterium]